MHLITDKLQIILDIASILDIPNDQLAHVLRSAGIVNEQLTAASMDTVVNELHFLKIETEVGYDQDVVRAELEKAVKREDYERAAMLSKLIKS